MVSSEQVVKEENMWSLYPKEENTWSLVSRSLKKRMCGL